MNDSKAGSQRPRFASEPIASIAIPKKPGSQPVAISSSADTKDKNI